jgi:hypothetical protein
MMTSALLGDKAANKAEELKVKGKEAAGRATGNVNPSWIWPTFRDRVGPCSSGGEQDAFAE